MICLCECLCLLIFFTQRKSKLFPLFTERAWDVISYHPSSDYGESGFYHLGFLRTQIQQAYPRLLIFSLTDKPNPPNGVGVSLWISRYFISSVQFNRSVLSDSLQPHELQHARPPCPSPTSEVHSDSHPSSQ